MVAQGKSITQPFFSADGEETIIKGETVQVFTYTSRESAKADADLMSPLGSPIGTSMVSWVSASHFYLKDTLLVLYVGLNVGVIERLETVMGPECAGVDPTAASLFPSRPSALPRRLRNIWNPWTSYLKPSGA